VAEKSRRGTDEIFAISTLKKISSKKKIKHSVKKARSKERAFSLCSRT